MKIAIIGDTLFANKACDFFRDEFQAEVKVFNNQNIHKKILSVQKCKILQNKFETDRKRILNNFRIIFDNGDQLDTYEEFDLVICAKELGKQNTLLETGASCLNENKQNVKEYITSEVNFSSNNSLALFTNSTYLKKIEKELTDWFYSDLKRKIFIQVDDEINFELDFFKKYDDEWTREVDLFLTKIENWKNLDSEERSQRNKPLEPLRRIELLTEYVPYSLEKMDDQKGIFLLFEKIIGDEIKSILIDKIIVLRNELVLDDGVFKGLNISSSEISDDKILSFKSEPGFYLYRNAMESAEEVTNALETVKYDILTFFKRK